VGAGLLRREAFRFDGGVHGFAHVAALAVRGEVRWRAVTGARGQPGGVERGGNVDGLSGVAEFGYRDGVQLDTGGSELGVEAVFLSSPSRLAMSRAASIAARVSARRPARAWATADTSVSAP
jgi:hypothetical protein